jgi:hypothetical protein
MASDAALPRLVVAIATIGGRGAGLAQVLPDPCDGVVWHVFWQDPDPTALSGLAAVNRPDLRITPLSGAGVARSRNAAIAGVEGDILLFADDDLAFCLRAYPALRAAFAQDPTLDFICGRVLAPDGRLRKRYGPDGQKASRWNTARVGTPELALRLAPVRAADIRFDETFGAGSANPLGDEYIFVCDALRAGLRGQHRALDLAVHPADSSGAGQSAFGPAHRRRAIDRALGHWAFPARVGFALRHRRRFASLAELLRFVF